MKETKLKLIIYSASALAGAIISFFVSWLAFGETALYAFFFAIFGAGLGVLIARISYHIATGDYAAEMWQVAIYMAIALTGWLGAVLVTTWEWVSLWLCVMSIGILMALGTRFVKKVAETIVAVTTKTEAPEKSKRNGKVCTDDSGETNLENTLRYRFMDDDPNRAPDLDRPLTLAVNRTALTISEAEEQGYTEEAEDGRAYLKEVLGV